jgi:hypothetical protein
MSAQVLSAASLEVMREVVRWQSVRGPLPSAASEVAEWLRSLRPLAPFVEVTLPLAGDAHEAALALSRLGVAASRGPDGLRLSFPADGDALDRCLQLAGLPALPEGGARRLLESLAGAPSISGKDARATARSEERAPPRLAERAQPIRKDEALPALSLRTAVQPSEAAAYGCAAEPIALAVLVANARVRESDLSLAPIGGAPVVAVCAEYGRMLTALSPPALAAASFAEARARGVPALRLGGLFRQSVELERLPESAVASPEREAAVARAEEWLHQLDAAWNGGVRCVVEVAWPVYRLPGGGLLDGSGQSMLPPLPRS